MCAYYECRQLVEHGQDSKHVVPQLLTLSRPSKVRDLVPMPQNSEVICHFKLVGTGGP